MPYDLSRATDRALRHIEVSASTGCSPAAFARALATGDFVPTAQPALTLLFDEGDADVLVELVTEGASTFATLAALSHALLPAGHPTTRFLSEPPL